MRINSINTALYTSKASSFGRTARPYPEYEKNHVSSFGRTAHPYPEYENMPYSNPSSLDAVLSRVYALFTPEVTRKSEEIKSRINKMYETNRPLYNLNGAPQQQLVSVFA